MTPKQIMFCNYYIENGMNGAQAALKAGYSKKTAKQMASENLAKPDLVAYIRARIKELLSDSEQLTLEWLKNVKKIAEADLRKAVDWDSGGVTMKPSSELDNETAYAISEVSQTTSKFGHNVSIKMESKTKALELLGKYLNILGNEGPAIAEDKKARMTADDRKKRIDYLLNKNGK